MGGGFPEPLTHPQEVNAPMVAKPEIRSADPARGNGNGTL
jgi:hypothetical protein